MSALKSQHDHYKSAVKIEMCQDFFCDSPGISHVSGDSTEKIWSH